MKDRNSILWQRVSKAVIRATHLKVTNISAGLIYEFKVAAENAAGVGAFSKVSDAVLAIDACGKLIFKTSQATPVILLQLPQKVFHFSVSAEPPINLRINDITKNSISLVWEKPSYSGGSPITGYIIEKREGASAKWSKANLTNITDTRLTVTGLSQEMSYEFRVMAKNAVGSVSNPSMTAGPATCVDTYGKYSVFSMG